jgi:transposase
MRVEEELAELRAENAELRVENAGLRQQVQDMAEALKAAQHRIEELEKKKKDPPSWVKANTPKREGGKKPRRKRSPEHNRARRRMEPTRIVEHELEACPDCGYRLYGRKKGHSHQVIDVPPPPPVEVTEHQIIKRWCPHCEKWQAPRLDLRQEALGQGRIGLRLTSLIVYLRNAMRLPYRQIQAYLEIQHQMPISVGGIAELLHRVSAASQEELQSLYDAARASAVVHADETGWREDGQNGYIWTLSVPGPEPIRLFHYNPSRSRFVVKGLLGSLDHRFQGVLCSDFLGSYNIYDGPHQRCWVHLLRDLHKLKKEHPDHVIVHAWAKAVRHLYDEAEEFVRATSPPHERERKIRYDSLLARLQKLGQVHARSENHPCSTLAKRLLRHQDEMFQFVLHPEVSADNNLAERSLRPLVIARKISGGTRGDAGTTTRMVLASLVSTWLARGLNPYEECLSLLRKTPLPQV